MSTINYTYMVTIEFYIIDHTKKHFGVQNFAHALEAGQGCDTHP